MFKLESLIDSSVIGSIVQILLKYRGKKLDYNLIMDIAFEIQHTLLDKPFTITVNWNKQGDKNAKL